MKGRGKSILRFLINYWTVLCLFTIVALLLGKGTEWLGSTLRFLGNATTLWYDYNGAWWYVSTYIFMVLLSPLVLKTVQRHPIAAAVIAAVVYFVTYQIRFSGLENFVFQHVARLGMSYSELLIGVYFCKYKWMENIHNYWQKLIGGGYTSAAILTVIATIIVAIRRYVATLFVAPISGMVFIIAYLLVIRQYPALGKPFAFLGKHSTNIWLVHMFFYLSVYGGVVFYMKYSVAVLAALLCICIGCSYTIKWFQRCTDRLVRVVVSQWKESNLGYCQRNSNHISSIRTLLLSR